MQYPLSVRNNNPGNIMSATYGGAIGATPAGYGIYQTPAAGWQAAEQLLGSYLARGFNTPNQIAQRWTGGDEGGAGVGNEPGSTANYAKAIADAYGIGPDDPIPSNNLAPGLTAMATFETGSPWQYGQPYNAATENGVEVYPYHNAPSPEDISQDTGTTVDPVSGLIQRAAMTAAAPVNAGTEPDEDAEDIDPLTGLLTGQSTGSQLFRMGLSILGAPGRGGNAMQAIATGLQNHAVSEERLKSSLVKREAEMAETRSRLARQKREETQRNMNLAMMQDPEFKNLSPGDQIRALGQVNMMLAEDPAKAVQTAINTENMISQRNAPYLRAQQAEEQSQRTYARQKALQEDRQAHAMAAMERNAELQQQGRQVLEQIDENQPAPVRDDLTDEERANALSSWDTIQSMPEGSKAERNAKLLSAVEWKERFGEGLNFIEERIRTGTMTPKDREARRFTMEGVHKGLESVDTMTALVDSGAPVTGLTGKALRVMEPYIGDLAVFPDGVAAFNDMVRRVQEDIIPSLESFKGTLSNQDIERLEALSGYAITSEEGLRHVLREARYLFGKISPQAARAHTAVKDEFRGYLQSGDVPQGSTLRRAPEYSGYLIIGPDGQPLLNADGEAAILTGD